MTIERITSAVEGEKPPPIEYSHSLVTYYDILGFREVVENRSALEIGGMLTSLTNRIRYDPKVQAKYGIETIAFSDTFIRSYRITDEAPLSKFIKAELFAVALSQLGLLSSGVFLRGCIGIGDLYSRNGTVFGPALVSGHRISEEVAFYPRVVIDPNALHEIRASFEATPPPTTKWEELGTMLRKDVDGIYYVDYLRAYPLSCQLYALHRKLIIANSAKHDFLDSTSAKINWLAHYHNSTVGDVAEESLKNCGCTRVDLLVPLGKIKTTYNLGEGV